MNTVDLRRPRRFTATCAAVAAFAWLGAQPASAEVANPNLVPAESAYIISIPDSPAFWSAWEANALYDAYKKVMAMPEVEGKVANFRKELGIVESSLGFKIDGATLSQVFGAMDLYVEPGTGDDKMSVAGVFKVTDEEKLTKILDLAEKAAAQAAAGDDESTDTETADSASTSAITESDYQGVKIKTFDSGDDKEFVFARTTGLFIIGSGEAPVKQIIDRSKAAAPGADTVAASENYKKIDAALVAEKGELYVYGNQDLAMKMQSGDDASAGFNKSLKALMDDFAPMSYYGASVNFEPKEIASYSYGILKEGAADSLLVKNPGDKPLKVLNYVPDSTMVTAATSLFDAKSLYDLVMGIADAAKADADSEEAAPGLQDKIKSAETILGFSVENDLIPAMSNEAGIAINEVEFAGLIPRVDATIMFGVADAAKMKKVVDSLERLATNALAAQSADSQTSAPGFTSEEVSGQTIKYLENPALMGFTPGFVLTPDFFIIGSTKSALSAAVEANAGTNLANGESLKALSHSISANGNMVQYANVSAILDTAKQVTNQIPAVKDAGKYIDALKVIEASGSVSRVENGAAIGHGVIKLN